MNRPARSANFTTLFAMAAALTLTTWLPACDGGEGHETHGDSEGHETHGENPDADEYEDGMQKRGEMGIFSIKLTSTPGPPSKGTNMWTLELSDSAGAIEGAQITVTPWMPEHGHGSTSPVTVTEESGGTYRAHPVELQMLGLWDTEITVEKDGQLDTLHFVFDVQTEGDTGMDHTHG